MNSPNFWQAAEKDPYASFRSIDSLQRTGSTPSLIDFSRASHLNLFEQPATRVFSSLPFDISLAPNRRQE